MDTKALETAEAQIGTPIVCVEKLNLHLGGGPTPLHILKDIDLSIAGGEVVAVVGPSGSGKTSLLMVLGGLEQASGRKIEINGIDIAGLGEDGLALFRRETLGILFQNFNLLGTMTALENVSLALEIADAGLGFAEIRHRARTALEAVGLGDRLGHLPNALSGGEQQRVGLARAMVARPVLLLADEPTGNLDEDTGAKMIDMMFDLARENGTAVLLITHDANLARRADRRLTMTHGRLASEAVVPS